MIDIKKKLKKKSDKERKLKIKMCIVTQLFQNQSIFSCGDLDLGDIDVILSHDTPSNNGEQMCKMILKSHNE